MPRKTKEEQQQIRANKWVDSLIQSNKFLREPKYHKNNYWSNAAWDSWAAKGQAGSCGCGCGYYNGSLCNTRRHTRRGGQVEHCKHVHERVCYDCRQKIEAKLNVKFNSKH